jgi:flagellar L-ring protein precursor FlgH
MFRTALNGLTAVVAISLGGCSVFVPKVDMPVQTHVDQKPPAQLAMAAPTGGLYSAATYTPLFEDLRARHVGDILVVQVSEKIDANQKNSMSASRTDSATLALPSLKGLFGIGNGNAINTSANGSKNFNGKGETTNANDLTGTLTVTVSDVLPNGNLRVVGEKQIGTNRDVEYLKFSGVVSPSTIQAGNVVSSSQVADARVEYRGKGVMDSATTMGWLSRFFLTVLPF